MNRLLTSACLTLALSLTVTACHRDRDEGEEHHEKGAKPVTEAEAKAVTEATIAAWTSMDAGKIDAVYAPDVVGFDTFVPALSTDRANWTKNQQGFAAAKLDKETMTQSKIQLVDDRTFIWSSVADMTSSSGTTKPVTIRCTDVFRKQDDGKFLVINEHCSVPPKAAA
ncbi:MAG: nuclear transport factor 2 family protein [Sphingomicrobium sp.]